MDIYIPLLSALAGTLIGAAASIIATLVQTRAQSRRDRTKEAVALAVQDWKFRTDLINQRGGKVLPLAVFFHYHCKLIELAESRELTPQALKNLSAEQDQLIEAIDQINDEWLQRSKNKQPT